MKVLNITISFLGLLAMSQLSYSGSIPDTYTRGDTLTAAKLTNIKSAVEDNDARLIALESGVEPTPDYSGYGTPFSADGATKNVIVSKRQNSDGSGLYDVQIFYANSTEQIQIDGVMITPSLIGKFVFANFDTNGNLTSLNTSTEAPQTTAYLDYVTEESVYDIVTGVKIVQDDTASYSDTCIGSGALGVCDTVNKISGVQVGNSQSHVIRTLLGSGGIGSMSFVDLLGREKYSGTRRSYRVHAKGIGRVLRAEAGRTAQRVIYYSVAGETGGSLAGTPFESGAVPFGGVFF